MDRITESRGLGRESGRERRGLGMRWTKLKPPFSGIKSDLCRRIPFYKSDWSLTSPSSTSRLYSLHLVRAGLAIYCANLLPALAYGLDMDKRTSQNWGTTETILASSLAALIAALLSCQPLTIVGVTGLIDLFGYTTYDLVTRRAQVPFLEFMAWTGIFGGLMHFAIAITNVSSWMVWMTDFSSDAFGLYVGIIYVIKGVELLLEEFHLSPSSASSSSSTTSSPDGGKTAGLLNLLLVLGFCMTCILLSKLGKSNLLTREIRRIIHEFAMPIAMLLFTGLSHVPGVLGGTGLRRYPITAFLAPTFPSQSSSSPMSVSSGEAMVTKIPRNWIVPFWTLPPKQILLSVPFSILLVALFYYDHNVSSLSAQHPRFPLRKPSGFHWDFAVLGFVMLCSAVLGIPFPNGLVPQAVLHTEYCAVWEREPEREASRVDTPPQTQTEEPSRGEYKITRILEQRWTHLIMALLLILTLSPPFLHILSLIPQSLFAGVFICVGWPSIQNSSIIARGLRGLAWFVRLCSKWLMDVKWLRGWRRARIMRQDRIQSSEKSEIQRKRLCTFIFLAVQIATVAVEVGISLSPAAIIFPLVILSLFPIRWLFLASFVNGEEVRTYELDSARWAGEGMQRVVLDSFLGGLRSDSDFEDEVQIEEGGGE